jgi:hypothetical protein
MAYGTRATRRVTSAQLLGAQGDDARVEYAVVSE